MKFGLFYLPTYMPDLRSAQQHYRGVIEQVEFADQIGIDYAWIVEHHFVRHGGLFPANYAFLSYLAARTKRIRLGTGATVLPLNDPVRVAEQAATLDQLSQGRFDFGVGRGFIRDEFDIFGVDMKESRERVEEGVELLKQVWAGPTMEFKSKFRPPLSSLPLLPPIFQKPHPPIWVACLMSPESFEWTAQEGHNLLYVAYHVDHPVAAERIGWYRDALAKHGRNVADHEICCVYHAHFLDSEDDERLAKIVHKPMSEYAAAGLEAARKPPDPTAYKGYERREAGQRDFGFDAYFPGRVVMGGPKQAIERIHVLRDIGITQIGLLVDFGSLAQEDIMRSLRIFADQVLPHVRDI
jgi:natural product biosynthesis luciferase-like monooxygenase protein